jgi:CheY-like chemotaxis protein/nitrogen-specific signal transduction histidine kinase
MGSKKEIIRLHKELEIATKKYNKNNDEKLILASLLTNVNHELEESLRNEKRFIASVSHELRTPMTSILGYGELLEDTKLSSQQKRYLRSITQSSHYLLSLINDLLDVAKFADKRVELSPKVVDLYDVLHESTTLIRSKIAEGVEFDVNIPILEHKIKVDDKRLKQIIINLLSNSAKFTKEGKIECFVDTIIECKHSNNMEVFIHIKDSGSGISKENAKKLFIPFSSTDKTQGTGLGLFISRELANLMDGDIIYKPVKGGGSLFILRVVVEKATKKEIGKGLIGTNILMCSPRNSFIDSIIMELKSMGMESFIHYDSKDKEISVMVIEMLAQAKNSDIVIFDADTYREHTVDIAKMFRIINTDIKVFVWMNDDTLVETDMFDMVISKPIAYQQFILEIENAYSKEHKVELLKKDYSKLKILIVEDVEINRIYQSEMLNNFFNIKCDTASNGAIALEMVEKNHYDAIFMDMRMPVMTGQEATRKIREFDTTTPIICMSANVYKEDKLEAQEAGMNAFIEKPLERIDIETQLLNLINHQFISKDDKLMSELTEKAFNHLGENFDETTSISLFDIAMVSINDSLNSIEKHTKSQNIQVLIDDFHALKGVLLNLGLPDLAEQASILQKSAKEGTLSQHLDTQEYLITTLTQLLEYK